VKISALLVLPTTQPIGPKDPMPRLSRRGAMAAKWSHSVRRSAFFLAQPVRAGL